MRLSNDLYRSFNDAEGDGKITKSEAKEIVEEAAVEISRSSNPEGKMEAVQARLNKMLEADPLIRNSVEEKLEGVADAYSLEEFSDAATDLVGKDIDLTDCPSTSGSGYGSSSGSSSSSSSSSSTSSGSSRSYDVS